MGNILVLRGADFSDAKIGTRTVPEATTSSGLYFRYIDSFTVTQSLTGCTSSNHTEHVQDGGTFVTALTANAGYNDITQDMITVVDADSNPVSFTFSGNTLTIENIGSNIFITVVSTVKQATLERIAVSGNKATVNIDIDSEKAYYTDINNLKNKITVTATFSDSTTQTVAAADYTLTCPQSLSTAGTKTFTVTYNSVTTTFTVEYIYQYYTISKYGTSNATSIVETIDGTQASSVTRVRWHQDYSISLTVDSTTTATVTINGTTNTYAPVNNVISITVTDVEADISINVIAAEQPDELNTPLYITAGEANSKLRLEFNVIQPNTNTTYEYASCMSNNIIEKFQYSTDLSTWSDFSIDSENTSYSNAINLTNVGDTVYIRSKEEINRTGLGLINAVQSIKNLSYHENMYYKFSYDNNGIYAYNSAIGNSAYYTYSLDAGMSTNADQRFITINVVKDDNSYSDFSADGNIMSLLYGGDNFKGKTEFPGVDELYNGTNDDEVINTISHSVYFKNTGGFTGLFRNTHITKLPKINAQFLPAFSLSNFALKCEKLTDISEFTMSLKHCSDWSCRSMFASCTNMTSLPNITGDYSASCGALFGMFSSVNSAAETGITDWSSIKLPATVSYMTCATMFSNCTNMEKSPTIIAEPIAPNSCVRMFLNCTSLNDITITSTTNEGKNKPSNSFIAYGLGSPTTTSAAYKGWLLCDPQRTTSGTIHIKQALIDTIPTGTSALTDTSIANANKYHDAGLPYYKSGTTVLPWNVDIIS